jgi:hypothetical protein
LTVPCELWIVGQITQRGERVMPVDGEHDGVDVQAHLERLVAEHAGENRTDTGAEAAR